MRADGKALQEKLEAEIAKRPLLSRHVGDVRGRGLFRWEVAKTNTPCHQLLIPIKTIVEDEDEGQDGGTRRRKPVCPLMGSAPKSQRRRAKPRAA